jgi:hypothetical protein
VVRAHDRLRAQLVVALDTRRIGGDDATVAPFFLQGLGDRLAIAVGLRCNRVGTHGDAWRATIGFFSPFFLDRR